MPHSADPEAIAVDRLWKYYGNYPALRDVTLRCDQSSCYALLGRNGAGKTTLLRILAGLSPYQRGTALIFGNEPRAAETRQQLGFLGHGIGVYEDLSAHENLSFFGRIGGLANAGTQADAWLKRVGLERVRDLPVRQFSRGMRQRLALARTFLNNPRTLLLDEPFTSLDDRAIAVLSELLVEARQRGATIMLSTHQLREALAIASHVALIENGRLRYTGARTQEMVDDPGFLYRTHSELGAA
jgi:heme ABC exporter ATP-binding subunit CcmA